VAARGHAAAPPMTESATTSITMAQPARHRERAGKLYLPAIQSSASLHNCRGSSRRWMKVQWQVNPIKTSVVLACISACNSSLLCCRSFAQRTTPQGCRSRGL
jgi:hypothetical protein